MKKTILALTLILCQSYPALSYNCYQDQLSTYLNIAMCSGGDGDYHSVKKHMDLLKETHHVKLYRVIVEDKVSDPRTGFRIEIVDDMQGQGARIDTFIDLQEMPGLIEQWKRVMKKYNNGNPRPEGADWYYEYLATTKSGFSAGVHVRYTNHKSVSMMVWKFQRTDFWGKKVVIAAPMSEVMDLMESITNYSQMN